MKRDIYEELVEGFNAYQDFQAGKTTLKTIAIDAPKPIHITPDEIKNIRKQLNLSQAVFARCLRMSVRTYQGWEQGKTRPNAQAVLLLKMVSQSPKTFENIATI